MRKLIIIAVLVAAGVTGCGHTHYRTPVTPSYKVSSYANIPGFKTAPPLDHHGKH